MGSEIFAGSHGLVFSQVEADSSKAFTSSGVENTRTTASFAWARWKAQPTRNSRQCIPIASSVSRRSSKPELCRLEPGREGFF